MLKILGRASSINVRKVLWVCDELDIAFRREEWGAGFRSPEEPAFKKLTTRKGYAIWGRNGTP